MSEQVIRHPNGGAQKIGLEVHVSADSFCDERSVIKGDSAVLHSSLTYSRIENSEVFSSTSDGSVITGSVASESRLCGVWVDAAVLDRVIAKTDTEGICKPLILKDVVAENCELYGNWTLEGNARIPTGIWHRAPRYKLISGENGVSVGLTESTDGHALMACWRKPLKVWLHAGPRLGRSHKWTEAQINDARLFFTELLDCPMET